MDVQAILAKNIRYYRKQLGLSQEKLAELCGLHRTYIGGIEQHRVNVSTKNIEKIANALNVKAYMLFLEGETLPGASGVRIINDVQPDIGDCGICKWTEEGIEAEIITPYYDTLSIYVLCALAEAGHTDDLAEAYKKVVPSIKAYVDEYLQNEKREGRTPTGTPTDRQAS